MLRTKLAKSYIKRTFRPLYGWTQMTPKSTFLDPAFDRSVAIYPGMVMTKGVGDQVTLIGKGTGTTDAPYGFSALYVGGDGIDEPLEAGINAFAVWVMGPDAEAEVMAPAFDTTSTWTDAAGTETLVYAFVSGAKMGQLCPAGASGGTVSSTPVARLIKVNSSTKITVGGLR